MTPETRKNKCYYCGCKLIWYPGTVQQEANKRTVDHIIPQSKHGNSQLCNLVYACEVCNNKKADLTLEEYKEKLGENITEYMCDRIDKLIKYRDEQGDTLYTHWYNVNK